MGLGNAKKSKAPSFDVMGLLTQHNTRWTLSNYQENQIVYSQGDPADSVFYIHRGKVKITVVSKLGKEAIVAIRGPDEFCGEGALTGTSAAFGYNHHNVDMRDHTVGEVRNP
jgi:CRP/FNR family cyclic AMP-dependent transcriptional regulator